MYVTSTYRIPNWGIHPGAVKSANTSKCFQGFAELAPAPDLLMPNPTFRKDLHPLCPSHLQPMRPVTGQPDSRYHCAEPGCTFCWQWDIGYFLWEDGQLKLAPNADSLMKQGLNRDHGYFYIEAVESGKKIWRCPVENCANTLMEP